MHLTSQINIAIKSVIHRDQGDTQMKTLQAAATIYDKFHDHSKFYIQLNTCTTHFSYSAIFDGKNIDGHSKP